MTSLHCRTFDLTAIRAALTAAIETQVVRVNPWLADMWSPPCALIGAFTIEFSDSGWEDLTTATVSVRLIVPAQALRPAQQDLDVMLGSYVAALNAVPTLNETCLRVLPRRAIPVATARGNQDLPSYDCETLIVL